MRDDRIAEDMDDEEEEPISNSEIEDDDIEGEEESDATEDKKYRSHNKNDTQRTWDEHCYVCDDGGDVMVCEGPNCRTVAHHNCMGLAKPPSGDWHCEECLIKLSRKRTTRGSRY